MLGQQESCVFHTLIFNEIHSCWQTLAVMRNWLQAGLGFNAPSELWNKLITDVSDVKKKIRQGRTLLTPTTLIDICRTGILCLQMGNFVAVFMLLQSNKQWCLLIDAITATLSFSIWFILCYTVTKCCHLYCDIAESFLFPCTITFSVLPYQ